MAATKAAGKTTVKKEKGNRFSFEGKSRANQQVVRGEVIAKNENEAREKLARRGVQVLHLQKLKTARRKKIKHSDVTLFARQLATMMKAGLPLLQAFEIVAKGHSNASMTDLLMDVRSDIEQGTSLSGAFGKHPKYFDKLFCSLVEAGEAGGVLDSLLDKLATYMEKTAAIKRKVKGALMYPTAVIIVAVALIVLMMLFVLPSFGKIYDGLGAELPYLTQIVMNISDFFVDNWWWMLIVSIVLVVVIKVSYSRSFAMQKAWDKFLLNMPIFGQIVKKAAIARWARTTATLFTAGVPLVEALESVAGAAGNIWYEEGTFHIRSQIQQGTSLTSAMQETNLFPNMVLQMAAIGEESGSVDDMLNKAAEFYEDEVDQAVATLSSLMEPIIMVVLGSIVGFLLIAMYLPLFNIGNVM